MKKIFTLILMMALAGMASAQVVMYEDFNYTAGSLVPSNGSWTNHSGTAGQVQITAGGLSFTNYPTNATSNKIALNASDGEDISKTFTASNAAGTKVYCSFLVNVSATNATGTYFAHFQNGTSTFTGRLFARTINSSVNFGLATTGTSATFIGSEFALNTTHLIVMSYEFVSGTGNDVIKLWVNPDLSGAEPAALVSLTTATDLASIQSFGFRQAGAATPVCTIDEIKVGLSWTNAPLPISLVKFEATKLAEKVKISWATATEVNNDKFIIERSADGENFEMVTEVRGAGNSRELNAYEVVDANPLKGTSYYRLTQYDFNGEFETFAPVAVSMEKGAMSVEHLAGSNELGAESMSLRVFSPLASDATISVRDLSGRTIYSEKIMLQEGYQNFNLATTNFGAGIYLVSLNSGTEVVMKKVKL